MSENSNSLINLDINAILAEYKVVKEEEPKTFDEAWNHPHEESSRKLHEAVYKEFQVMKSSRYDRRHVRSHAPKLTMFKMRIGHYNQTKWYISIRVS